MSGETRGAWDDPAVREAVRETIAAERGPSGTGHATACPECGTPGAANVTHVCATFLPHPFAEPRVTEAAPARADFDRRVLVESFKQAADEADARLVKMNDAAMLVLRVRLRLDALDARESKGKPLMRFPSERRLLDEALELLTRA